MPFHLEPRIIFGDTDFAWKHVSFPYIYCSLNEIKVAETYVTEDELKIEKGDWKGDFFKDMILNK